VIENDLTRIADSLEVLEITSERTAAALERIANFFVASREEIIKNANMLVNAQTQGTNPVYIEPQPMAANLPEEVKEIPPPRGTMFVAEVKETPVEIEVDKSEASEPETTPAPELKFEEVSKEFFALLNTIKASKGLEEAKQVATDLIRQYNNGKPISLATLPKEAYAPLFEKITQAKAEYEPA
jgi:hypothetical protein